MGRIATIARRFLLGSTLLSGLALAGAGMAQAGSDGIKIGVMSDQAGPFSDINGTGVILAARMAIEEVNGEVLGKKITLLTADPQNKTDVGMGIAKQWLDRENLDFFADLPSSSLALGLQEVLKTSGKGLMGLAGPNAAAITGPSCTKYGFMWATDSYASAHAMGGGMVKEGADSWYFIQVEWAAGESAANDLQAVIEGAGGKVVGRIKHATGTTDFSSFLLQAQASKAKAIALINSGTDFMNSVRQAKEFGIVAGGQKLLAGLTLYVTDGVALGLPTAQGLTGVSGFEWNQSPETEAWARRFFARQGKMPNAVQIGQYSQVKHYLKALAAAGTDDRDAVAAKMRALKVNDAFVRDGWVRADGRMMHDIMLIQVKSPAESKETWDVFKVLRTIKAEDAFRPLDKGGCPIVK